MAYDYSLTGDMDLWLSVKEHANGSAFGEIHRRFALELYHLAYRKTGEASIAEDLVQELFISMWVQRENINIEKSLKVYLFSSLKNKIISHWRKAMLHDEVSLFSIPAEDLSIHSRNTIEENVFFMDTQKQYEFVLQTLPEKSREVFELSRSGLSNKEIAGLLNIVEKTVEFHMSKCLKVLRTKLIYGLLFLLAL